MAHGNVAVHTHHGERKDTGEHIVVVDSNEDLADHFSKRPGIEKVVCALKGHRGGDKGIGESKVENVNVGGCLHLCVPVKHANHKAVL